MNSSDETHGAEALKASLSWDEQAMKPPAFPQAVTELLLPAHLGCTRGWQQKECIMSPLTARQESVVSWGGHDTPAAGCPLHLLAWGSEKKNRGRVIPCCPHRPSNSISWLERHSETGSVSKRGQEEGECSVAPVASSWFIPLQSRFSEALYLLG